MVPESVFAVRRSRKRHSPRVVALRFRCGAGARAAFIPLRRREPRAHDSFPKPRINTTFLFAAFPFFAPTGSQGANKIAPTSLRARGLELNACVIPIITPTGSPSLFFFVCGSTKNTGRSLFCESDKLGAAFFCP